MTLSLLISYRKNLRQTKVDNSVNIIRQEFNWKLHKYSGRKKYKSRNKYKS